jgi:glyoxylase-like metal-dependent hydrolase (beta-lactamase superfamily II)
MTTSSRRTFVLSAAAAGAAYGLDGRVAFIGDAHAQQKAPGKPSLMDKGFAKFKVGDIEVTQIFDGVANAPYDANMVPGKTAEEVKAAYAKAGITSELRPNYFTVTVVKMKGKTIMFDSSTGGQLAPTAGLMMAKNMYAAGVDPWKIDTIIVTHFHPDHISGMISKETNSQVFPNAQIIMPATEYKHWTAPDLAGKVPDGVKPLVNRIQSTFPKWKNITQVEADKEVVPGIRSVATYGHTPGHTSYIVSSGKKQLMVLGDVTSHYALNVANPDWSISFDNDKAMAAETRRKVFDRAIADKIVMTGYHWGMPGAGTVKKDGNGYAFMPVKI